MKLMQSVRVGIWLLILINVLMSFACLWLILRMSPAIGHIYDRNERSLVACEKMMLALFLHDANQTVHRKNFEDALKNAESNVTEKAEPVCLKEILNEYPEAFSGVPQAREKTVNAIARLAEINREAMVQAAEDAQKNGFAGAWGIVFMSISVFTAGLLFKRFLSLKLIEPLREIQSVLNARKNGDRMRRCSGANLSPDTHDIYREMNALLDQTDHLEFKG